MQDVKKTKALPYEVRNGETCLTVFSPDENRFVLFPDARYGDVVALSCRNGFKKYIQLESYTQKSLIRICDRMFSEKRERISGMRRMVYSNERCALARGIQNQLNEPELFERRADA